MITTRIRNQLGELTAAERKIAAYVLSAPQAVSGMTVHTLAAHCGTASSAVIRFCKSVKLSGFTDLKLALARELGSQKEELPAFEQGDGTEQVVRKVFRSGMQTLRDTVALTDMGQIERMADALATARRIFLFGIGTSAIVAADAQYRLSQLGLWATACTDILQMNVTAANLTGEDVVLAISHSGQTKAVVDAVRRARRAGATTLGITSFTDSLLYRDCAIATAAYADEDNYPVEAVSARIAHLCLIDALAMVLATNDFEAFAAHVMERNAVLKEIRYEKEQKGRRLV